MNDHAQTTSQMDSLRVDFSFEWEVVLQGTDEEYRFPNPITDFMKQHCGRPAIYRWNIYQGNPTGERLVYIGEAGRLCPDRIKNYLRPGPSQETSKRLNGALHQYLGQGFTVRLEVLKFDRIAIGSFGVAQHDLHTKSARRFIEELLITVHRLRGIALLNL